MALAALFGDGGSHPGWMLGGTPKSWSRCGRRARSGSAGGVGAGSHWLPSARPLAETFPALGWVRLMGRDPVNLTLPVRGSPGSLGQELPPSRGRPDNEEMQGPAASYCLRERKREGLEDQPSLFSGACRHSESLGPRSCHLTTETPPAEV